MCCNCICSHLFLTNQKIVLSSMENTAFRGLEGYTRPRPRTSNYVLEDSTSAVKNSKKVLSFNIVIWGVWLTLLDDFDNFLRPLNFRGSNHKADKINKKSLMCKRSRQFLAKGWLTLNTTPRVLESISSWVNQSYSLHYKFWMWNHRKGRLCNITNKFLRIWLFL